MSSLVRSSVRPLAPARLLGVAGDPTPLYFKLEGILRSAILSRQYPAETALPSERQLGELYGVSRITVRRALDSLERDQLVRRGRGRGGGTFVQAAGRTPEAVKLFGAFDALFSTLRISRIEVLAFDVRPCPPDVAAALKLSAEEPVRFIERVLSTPQGPVAHVQNFVPLAAGGTLRRAELRTAMLNEVLRRHGVKVAEIEDEVEACVADSRIAVLLGVRPGTPLLAVRRLFLAPAGEPVNLTALLIRSDRYRMTVRLRDHVLE